MVKNCQNKISVKPNKPDQHAQDDQIVKMPDDATDSKVTVTFLLPYVCLSIIFCYSTTTIRNLRAVPTEKEDSRLVPDGEQSATLRCGPVLRKRGGTLPPLLGLSNEMVGKGFLPTRGRIIRRANGNSEKGHPRARFF